MIPRAPASSPTRRRYTWLTMPAAVWWLAFFVVPVVLVLIASVGAKVPGSAGQVSFADPSFARYQEALGETMFHVLLQGMRTSLMGTLVCFIVAFPIAYYLATRVRKYKGLLLALLMVPYFTNFLVRTIAWRIVLAPNGWLSTTLQEWGWRAHALDILDTRLAVQIGVVYNYLPLMIFPLFVALDRLDYTLREASSDLGATRWQTFWQITVPLAKPGIVAGMVLVFVPLSGDYITAAVLGGAKGNMPGALVASLFLQGQDPASGAALAVILVAAIVAALGAFALVGAMTMNMVRKYYLLPPASSTSV